MKLSILKGFSYGLTSGVITTLGLMVGLHAGTHSKTVVISGILVIAVADALSDALGIHISEESENQHTQKEIWQSTLMTFAAKFVFALTFVVPILIFSLPIAIIASVAWGLFLIALFSYYLAKRQQTKPWGVMTEHLLIAILVITLTHYLGDWLNRL
ncbi:MAG: hypothetical protein A2927_00290 [Candidatus Komeilibacteria bacterium RIFCSPLOWO2_01_FULL_45_10]|uniref:VIT family protein n=1 Tax=Candidatus Komeilibacteria bacterium RIFCSPLOWO2_01_FULL_45_10 TaxID=1798550 RepID=A0A1G2BKT3_9BACT|nr:MAG: hypothetical protein A2927_00290 [Candidatus Komeilibacteria bacterium RIFCSPLOWO2_01_FULL_45_10]